jgi:hypothetical protein
VQVISGIRALGFWGFKYPNTAYNNPMNSESNKMWDPLLRDFGFWDFGIYEHMAHKHK